MKTQKTTIKKLGWGFGGCNMNCRHCYNSSGMNFPKHSSKNLREIADRICNEGVTDINFGTGEFLVNPNALQVAKYIKDKYKKVNLGLTTNGFSVVKMQAKDLIGIFHDIDVSIDFPDQKKHNEFRQHPKAWDWALEALEKCQKLGIERSVVTCVTSKTKNSDVEGLLAIAKKYDASLRINWFRPTGRGDKSFCVAPLRYWQIINLLADAAVFEGLSDPLLKGIILSKNKFEPCGCGWTSARIQQDLSVTPCVFLKGEKWSAGSIKTSDLKTVRENFKFKKIRKRFPNKCKDCQYKACRGGCYSRAVLQMGDSKEVDAFCPFRDKRTEKLINQIKEKIVIHDSNKVHHGYLCTLITKPKEKKNEKE